MQSSTDSRQRACSQNTVRLIHYRPRVQKTMSTQAVMRRRKPSVGMNHSNLQPSMRSSSELLQPRIPYLIIRSIYNAKLASSSRPRFDWESMVFRSWPRTSSFIVRQVPDGILRQMPELLNLLQIPLKIQTQAKPRLEAVMDRIIATFHQLASIAITNTDSLPLAQILTNGVVSQYDSHDVYLRTGAPFEVVAKPQVTGGLSLENIPELLSACHRPRTDREHHHQLANPLNGFNQVEYFARANGHTRNWTRTPKAIKCSPRSSFVALMPLT
jgi:hypothetical protein